MTLHSVIVSGSYNAKRGTLSDQMSNSAKERFERDGYLVAPAVFPRNEIHDPLKRYPRMAQMHRWDAE